MSPRPESWSVPFGEPHEAIRIMRVHRDGELPAIVVTWRDDTISGFASLSALAAHCPGLLCCECGGLCVDESTDRPWWWTCGRCESAQRKGTNVCSHACALAHQTKHAVNNPLGKDLVTP